MQVGLFLHTILTMVSKCTIYLIMGELQNLQISRLNNGFYVIPQVQLIKEIVNFIYLELRHCVIQNMS
jgi:hypothetical protein